MDVGPEPVAGMVISAAVDPTEAGNNRCSAATCAVLQVGPETGRTFGLQALAD
jgi:hypothetical protein